MITLELIEITEVNDALAQMVAQFRVELCSYKGIATPPVETERKKLICPRCGGNLVL